MEYLIHTIGELSEQLEEDLGETYALQGFLGYRACSTTWRVHERSTGRDLMAHCLDKSPANFLEAMHPIVLLRHSGLLSLVSVFEAPSGRAWLIYEHCSGGNLQEELRRNRGRHTEVADVSRLARDLAAVLAWLHERGVVHGGLKPESVVFSRRCEKPFDAPVRLADLGVRQARERARMPACKTLDYLAPEQFFGRLTQKSDIYSLGVILCEIFATPSTDKVARPDLSCGRQLSPDLPEPWDKLLPRMMDIEPRRRPTAAALHEAVERAVSGTS